MWNKFSIKIQLIVFITLVVSVVELATLFTISNIQKTQSENSAFLDIRDIIKSLNNDMIKIILKQNSDILSDLSFRLSAFKKINGLILFNRKNQPIYRYKKIKQILINRSMIMKKNNLISGESIFAKVNISANDYNFGYILVDTDKSGYRKRYIALMIDIATIFPFSLLLGIILSLFIGNNYTRPFSKLLDAMKKSDPNKNVIIKVKTSAQNEIKDLFNGFNNQMEHIRTSTQEISRLNQDIEETQKEVIFTMGSIGETRSKETGNHVKRVAQYSKILALHYGLSEKEADMLKQASPMHDIGKVGIPDNILNKPGRFNAYEREIMNTHAQLGYDMLKASNKQLLKLAAVIAYEHHEKWDGSGYPRGLKGENINIAGRITAVADVFDALGSDRVYKKAWNDDRIFNLFKKEKGKHFDPKLINIFFEHLYEFLEVRSKFKDAKL